MPTRLLIITLLLCYAVSNASAAEPLPIEFFSRLPDVTKLTISPDGTKVVSQVRYEHEGVRGVVLLLTDFTKGKNYRIFTSDNSKFVLGWIRWAGNDAVLASAHYPARIYGTPVTATRLLRVDLSNGEIDSAVPTRALRKAEIDPIVQDHIIDFMPDSPDEFIISLRTTNEVGSSVFLANHKTRKSKRLHQWRAHTMNWMTDQQNTLRIAHYFKDKKNRYEYRPVGSKTWQPLFEYDTFSESAKQPLGFGTDPNILYFVALHEGRDAVFKADLRNTPLQPELVHSDPVYDVGGSLIRSPKDKRVVGVRHSLGRGYTFWDDEYQGLQKSVNIALPDTNNKIIEFSDDERRAIVFSTSDTNAGTYYLWDRDNRSMSPIAYAYESLDPATMAEKQSISYQARDGLEIEGFLTRPKDHSDEPGPTIVFPHGGPISYDGKGFDYWTQYFASRGYNVLQMNFRGSYGYGHNFMSSGLQDWGGKMQTDVEDGARWLIKQKVADPNRICVVGASYGGYAALMEAANNKDLYQCAVSFAGVTDLRYLVTRSRRYVNSKVVKEMVGSNTSELKKRSPVRRAEEIDVPILLVHGTKDIRVPIAHGRRMHKRLQAADKDVTYIELKDGNHYLSNEEHRVRLFKEMDAFLAKYLQ